MSNSIDLRFHLQVIEHTNEAWEKLETIFGKQNGIQVN